MSSQKRTNQTIQLLINSQKIDQVKETVFLGVIMDENLNWKSEISHVANKVSIYPRKPYEHYIFL